MNCCLIYYVSYIGALFGSRSNLLYKGGLYYALHFCVSWEASCERRSAEGGVGSVFGLGSVCLFAQ